MTSRTTNVTGADERNRTHVQRAAQVVGAAFLLGGVRRADIRVQGV